VSEETVDARMERLLRTLPPALRGMGFGDPDDAEYAHASDVVAWAIREIARLREERRWVPVGERLPEIGTDVLAMGSEGVFQACLTLWGESRRWEALVLDVHGCGCCGGGRASVTHWMPLPPGPEGDGNG
jgi:hypothetical protein